ncbi:MAG: sulfatase family protein [Planctomycetota bacterium]
MPHDARLTRTTGKISRRQFLKLTGAAALAGTGISLRRFAAAESLRPAAAKPNFVIIFTDDQGYSDVGCFGSENISTPYLDEMAAQGVKFTDFYVAGPVCTPSRAALMTGCYPKRVGLAAGVLFPKARRGLSLHEITIAGLLKARGYATACIGKWHLGDAPEFLPTRHGFDHYYGIPYSNDMAIRLNGCRGAPLMCGEEIIEHPVVQSTLTERYTLEAIDFIKASAGRPFFLYLPHTMPHVPLHVSERFRGRSARGLYGDVIECIDWSTGEILRTLKELGLDENTLVIFTSDNGPWLRKGTHGGSARPLRAGKDTTYEGGMRVPCIMRWPGGIPAGKQCSQLATTMDLLPTLAALAGTEPPADRVIDGRHIRLLMAVVPGVKTPHEAFFYHSARGQLQAVRSGKWKLHLARTGKAERPQELYDLRRDISEAENVAADNREVVERLAAMAAKFEAELEESKRPAGLLPRDPRKAQAASRPSGK